MEYGNSDWKNLLTKVTYTDDSGTVSSGTLEYDWIGNPVKYFNGHKTWDFTWKYGRQLTNATDGTNVIVNTYDVDGIRQSKTVESVEHKYTTLDGKVVREETSNGITVDYFYDNEGKPYKLKVHVGDNTYVGYYVLNQQGDVIAIVESSGAEVVSYRYNAWGKILEETASETSTGLYLGGYNALKYRGYYYDAETGFYYVSSRYYDPVIGRFINADDHELLLEDQGNLLQYNLYTYCWNNPVNMSDESGDWPSWATKVAIGAAAIAVGAAAVALTGGGAVAILPAVLSSLKVAATSAAISAGTSAVGNRISTGSWKGTGKALLNGAADGFMWGGITAGATTVALAAKGTYINKIGNLKPTGKSGNGYTGVRYSVKKSSGKLSYKSIELHSPHTGGKHNFWHWQKNQWSYYNKIWSISDKKAKVFTLFGKRVP